MAVSSTAWMLASTQCAGFVSCGPVAWSVTVTSHRSRPSWLVPYDSTSTSSGWAAARSCSQVVSSS